MSKQVLVDTNILIYAIDADSSFNDGARKIILNPEYDLFTTSKNISEFLVVLTRSDLQLATEKALSVLSEVIPNFTILYPSDTSFTIFEKLLKKYKPIGLRIHDMEILSIGLAAGIKTIATHNISDFKSIDEIELISL